MEKRLQLHSILCHILDCPEKGKECRVYFQPPANLLMTYDCIRYEKNRISTMFADNAPYKFSESYQIIAIYRDPDSDLPMRIAQLPMCSHERHYVADNLYHDTFNLYF